MSPKIEQSPPKYAQIANYIRNQILQGELKPGDEIPSERRIVEDWQVSRPTATHALFTLRIEGLVEARLGAGTFVRAQPKPNPRPHRHDTRAQATETADASAE
ncbi:MAG: winged helix-turn-helix domain-containing protein [Egibacteraceae bacterium]